MSHGEPAPVRLMNTIWADTGGTHDDLTSTADLRNWLVSTGTSGPTSATGRELDRARLLRDALRRLAAFVTDDARLPAQSPLTDLDEAIAVINELATDAPRDLLAVRRGQLALTPDSAVPCVTAALADIATEAVQLFTGPEAETLQACLAPRCVRYFTKSHPRREWCSEACGNRVRAARHYQRVRDGR